jgi:hypothetical protein
MARRNPLDLYENLITEAQSVLGVKNRAEARKWLGQLRRKAPDPRLLDIISRNGVGIGYVTNHLLSIETWSGPVRNAIHAGLPLATARKVAKLPDERQGDALLAFSGSLGDRMSAKSRAREVERAVIEIHNELSRSRYTIDRRGWLEPEPVSVGFDPPLRDVWLFPQIKRAKPELENLHPWIARAIIQRYSPYGGFVIDPMAGAGTIGDAARELGRWSFSSDIKPPRGASHVKRLKIEDIEQRLPNTRADLVVLHPPTFGTWHILNPNKPELDYQEFLSDTFGICADLVKEGGFVVAVTRPGRQARGGVVDTFSPVLACLHDPFGGMHAQHIAVAQDSSEDWIILVGRKPNASELGTVGLGDRPKQRAQRSSR